MLTWRELARIGLTIACAMILEAWREERVRDPVLSLVVQLGVFVALLVTLRPPLRRLRATPGWWRLAPVGALVVGVVASVPLLVVERLLARRLPETWAAAFEEVAVRGVVIAALLTLAAFVVAGMDAWRARLGGAGRNGAR